MGKQNICSLNCLTFHLLFPVSQEVGGPPRQEAPGVIQFLHKHDYTSKTTHPTPPTPAPQKRSDWCWQERKRIKKKNCRHTRNIEYNISCIVFLLKTKKQKWVRGTDWPENKWQCWRQNLGVKRSWCCWQACGNLKCTGWYSRL